MDPNSYEKIDVKLLRFSQMLASGPGQLIMVTRRAIWRALGRIGALAEEAVEVLEEMLPTLPHRGWKQEVESVIASCRGETAKKPLPGDVESARSTRDGRRIRIKGLLAHATNKSSLAHETRNEAMRLLNLRYRAADSLCDEAASVVRDFIRDMRGAAPSRKVAIERLRSSFNDMDEAKAVLNRLHNSYRYRQVFRPYIHVARQALELDKQQLQVIPDETAFPAAVLAVMNDPLNRSSFRQLVGSGPAGVPFLAPFVGHPEKAIHLSVCFKLRSMGPLAVEATPALQKAVDGEHSKFTLMALERVNPSANYEVPAGAGR